MLYQMFKNWIIMFWANKNQKENANTNCLCSSVHGFFITRQQASVFSASVILFLLFIFIVGYFWGQRKAIVDFTDKINEESFTDKVNYSFYSMYGNSKNENEEESEGKVENASNPEVAPPIQINDVISNENIQPLAKTYSTALVGYPSLKPAQDFVNRLAKKGYNTIVRTRKSKTPKGKEITWYQVVTDKFENEDQMNKVVNEIKKLEKIK